MSDLISQAVHRGQVMADIQSCMRCSARLNCKAPVTFRGPTPSPYMLIGEAPSAFEDKIGKVWLGNSGRELDQMFRDAHLPDLAKWFMTNAVCCAPENAKAPDPAAIFACRQNLRAQVDVCDPQWVLTFGITALVAVGVKNPKLNQVHGRPFLMPVGPFKDRWILPTFHPAVTLRDATKTVPLSSDLSTFSRIMSHRITPESMALTVGRNGSLVPSK